MSKGSEDKQYVSNYYSEAVELEDIHTSQDEEYVPYLDMEYLGAAGLNADKESMLALGFVEFDYEQKSTELLTLKDDQQYWYLMLGNIIWFEIYDESLGRVVGDMWAYLDVADFNTGWKDIVEANVDPRICLLTSNDGSPNGVLLFWKYNNGYVQFFALQDGTDKWANWEVYLMLTIEDVEQFPYYKESVRFDNELIKKDSNAYDVNNDFDLYDNFIDDLNNNESATPVASIDFIEGGLPESVYEIVKGHYENEYGDTIDFIAPTCISKLVKVGTEENSFIVYIYGYSELPSGYFIYVKRDGDKRVYYYSDEGDAERIYVSTDDGWNPDVNNFSYIQVYEKVVPNNSDSYYSDSVITTGIDEPDNPWGMDGANEGGLPDNVYEIVKGTYYAELYGLTVEIVSPTEIIYDEGITTNVSICGCDYCDDVLILYAYDNYWDYEYIITIFYTDNSELGMSIGSGGWDYDFSHSTRGLEKIK